MQIPAPTNSQKQSMKCTGQNRHPDPRQRPRTETCPPKHVHPTPRQQKAPKPQDHPDMKKQQENEYKQKSANTISPTEKPPKPHSTQKKVFHALSFQPRSKANSKFSFYDSLCEINGIKLQTMIQVSKSIYFPRDSLRPTCFDAIIRKRLKKKLKLL